MNQDVYIGGDINELLRLYDTLCHVGTPQMYDFDPNGSGRYRQGSGKNPNQHARTFLEKVNAERAKGLTDKEIYTNFGMNSSEFRDKISYDKAMLEKHINEKIYSMAFDENGNQVMTGTEIAKKLGMNQSTVNNKIKRAKTPNPKETKGELLLRTVDTLKTCIERDGMIDVGRGVNIYLGITNERLGAAINVLKTEGYSYISDDPHGSRFTFTQQATGKQTPLAVLAPPGTTKQQAIENLTDIKLPFMYSEDGGKTFTPKEPIKNIDLKRVYIRYPDEGGTERDGTIEIRRGTPDLDLGYAHYAQVRIGVDTTGAEKLGLNWSEKHQKNIDNGEVLPDKVYLKGVAINSDEIPKGYDVVFNTAKPRGSTLDKVFKEQKTGDPANPFGASLKYGADGEVDENAKMIQRHYLDKDGARQLSALNIVNEEGDWNKWSRNLPSQVLGKQDPKIAKKQLDIVYQSQLEEFNKINSLTNPYVKEKLMADLADDCDSKAVHLKAAALPRQKTHLLLPSPTIAENEIYAPNYEDGEKVYLIRFPHSGPFEIPVLTVNNSDPAGKKIVGNGSDAVCINHKAAEVLSGADFDGDTAIVIPAKSAKFKTSKPLKDMEGFDNKVAYPEREGMNYMGKKQYGKEMGKITNLITDMTVNGTATDEELARAVKFSMVVIDAYKHKLDWKRAESELRIQELKNKYQPKIDPETGEVDPTKKGGGAHTIFSRAKNEEDVPVRRQTYKIDPETGEKVWMYTGDTKWVPKGTLKEEYTDPKTGKIKTRAVIDPDTGKKKPAEWVKEPKVQASTQMYEATDAFKLSSGMEIENVYAAYANQMKALGNQARLARLSASKESIKTIPGAKTTYADEIASVNGKLQEAYRKAPLERQANLIAIKNVELKKMAQPSLKDEPDKLKKVKRVELENARNSLGINSQKIEITDREWEAIQSGAVGKTAATELFKRVSKEELVERAMPREVKTLSASTVAKIKSLSDNGYTLSEIANYLGLSTDSVAKYT